jgi:ketosteroid isomerase-like protein
VPPTLTFDAPEELAMTDRKTIEALIENAYHARSKGDVEGLMSAFHPEAVFELAGSKTALAVTGASRGHQDVRTTMTGLAATFEFIQRDIISMTIDGDSAAVHSRIKVRSVPKDQTATTDILDLFKFKDGKVIELVEFADTALIKDMMTVD